MRVGSSLGEGTITEVLTHAINATVDHFTLPTAHGLLRGTLDHPIHLNGSWLEVADAAKSGLLPELTTSAGFVHVYYNLEIDGDKPGASAHAYDLNGFAVSGLGDNEALNQRYQRQKVFQRAAAA